MGSNRPRLLVVEDHPDLQRQLASALDAFDIDHASTRAEALNAVRRNEPAVVLLDLGLPPQPGGVEEGFAALAGLVRAASMAKIIVMAREEERENALRAVRLGAYDICHKPLDSQLLPVIVDRARRVHELEAENRQLAQARSRCGLEGLIASSEAMVRVCRLIQKLARSEATVLLLGESGTGKEHLARALHVLSARAAQPMVAINCAAIPEPLLESELFGYERGAFTGAVRQTPGKIECAGGGTLFLDEIGDMPLPLQAKLLRFLQERAIERVGGRGLIPVDLRIVAATHRDLKGEVARGRFRGDLYYRISEVSVAIPPLRDRGADAVLIANHLLQRACKRYGKPRLKLTADAVAAIEHHPWPGNVRELENRIRAAAIMTDGGAVSASNLSLAPGDPGALPILPLREVRQQAEVAAARNALAAAGGNIAKAAQLLGVTRPTFYVLMRRAPELFASRPAEKE